MLKQKDLIDKMDWDVLIILDACRYDTFCNVFLFTDVMKVESSGTATVAWLKATWNGKYDNIIYLSGNPYVNSKGIKMNLDSFVGKDHFDLIADCWDFAFDKKTGRIESANIKMNALRYIPTLYDNQKLVIHFMQPHSPYIFNRKSGIRLDKVLKRVLPIKCQVFLNRIKFLRKLKGTTEKTYSNIYTDKEIRKAYIQNLVSARDDILDIVNECTRYGFRVTITADHGELLGEYGRYGHGGKPVPELIHVPWIEVGGIK